MKKLISMMLLLAVLFSSSAIASGDPVNKERVEKAFRKNYPQATFLNFETVNGSPVISFFNNGRHCMAVYNDDATQRGEGRFLTADELPMKVSRVLQSQFAGYVFIEALEYSRDGDDAAYYVSLAGAKTKTVVKVYPSGYFEIKRKSNKNQ